MAELQRADYHADNLPAGKLRFDAVSLNLLLRIYYFESVDVNEVLVYYLR